MVDLWEKHFVMVGMVRRGGSFVAALGKALMQADDENTAKIKNTWSEYWTEYLAIGRDIYDREQTEKGE